VAKQLKRWLLNSLRLLDVGKFGSQLFSCSKKFLLFAKDICWLKYKVIPDAAPLYGGYRDLPLLKGGTLIDRLKIGEWRTEFNVRFWK
jgi:hypothetical protein